MRNTRSVRTHEPSFHQSALMDLRRGGKFAAVFLVLVFGAMGLFLVAALVIAKQSIPDRPAIASPPAEGVGSAPPSGSAAAATGQDHRREQLVRFLTAAAHPGQPAWRTWMPAKADTSSAFVYTPLSPADPGAREAGPGATARVRPSALTPAQTASMLEAVTRRGSVRPSSVAVSHASGRASGWTLDFVVRTSGGNWLEGRAAGSDRASGETVLSQLTYRR
ncbi:hypothetical protein [Wenjunlia tyrosinilytica]|jgi:hypothetical protein|uniref:Uncharacterized protein n=1 Tax=Wenjunlia tyrosinilytica TaxID=1544741 RepID=A0A918E0B9_9ACTN|nr:hypothetical protein [Wenjunlia tyrosinilytica]GGO98072.1 hypothetical protein GCM10012280_61350 [Wenjunlia tyrosinilytica]